MAQIGGYNTLPSHPEVRKLEKVAFYFDNPLNMNLQLVEQIHPEKIDGAEERDFITSDYILFRARLEVVESSQGLYRKVSERGIMLEENKPGMRLEYRRMLPGGKPREILLKKQSQT